MIDQEGQTQLVDQILNFFSDMDLETLVKDYKTINLNF